MVITVKKKATRMMEQQWLAKSRSDAMWRDIDAERTAYQLAIGRLSEKYDTSVDWMSQQLFLGGKLLKSGTWMGRETLAIVSREAKESGGWKELPQHEIDDLMESLEDDDTSAPVKVTARSVAADIEGTISRIQPELLGLERRTGCNVMWIVTCGKMACLHLLKTTVEKLALQTDAYVVSGASGVIRMTTGRKMTKLKAEIREMFFLDKILTEMAVLPDDLPAVAYNSYDAFVVKWGIELTGWTEAQVTNPGNITSSVTLSHLHSALKDGDCHWCTLSSSELKSKAEEFKKHLVNGEIKSRATRSDKGTKKKARISINTIKSRDTLTDTDDDDDDDANENNSSDNIKTRASTAPTAAAMDSEGDTVNHNIVTATSHSDPMFPATHFSTSPFSTQLPMTPISASPFLTPSQAANVSEKSMGSFNGLALDDHFRYSPLPVEDSGLPNEEYHANIARLMGLFQYIYNVLSIAHFEPILVLELAVADSDNEGYNTFITSSESFRSFWMAAETMSLSNLYLLVHKSRGIGGGIGGVEVYWCHGWVEFGRTLGVLFGNGVRLLQKSGVETEQRLDYPKVEPEN
ncbi:uncharacterized protein EDB91DRAFT_1087291 [Suillus paluster]|uniref:uncharacterized protein n=1 Tax=Suillus paluster TaxID=48578 RepID=UPI001B85D44F|nr:uncharacterized protein EDB91DRAFT_1087291 [Suillus paluster]KAG1724939.1 hypothetical protein EDB91DRAFT_1087291 [Suillus paluster]